MKNIWVLFVLAAVAVGCGKLTGGGSGTSGNNVANVSSTPVPKVVDLSALLGKSVEEMNTALGQQQKLSVGSVTYTVPKGTVYAQYNKENKQVMISFSYKPEITAEFSVLGYPSVEKLGQAVGLEIKGKPSESEYEDKYYDYMINGKKCELTVKKMQGAYTGADLYCPIVPAP